MNKKSIFQKELEKIKVIWDIKKLPDKTYSLIKYKGTKKKVIIPGFIGKYKITKIDKNCFTNNDNIEELDIHENIEIIEKLSNFKKLKVINFHKEPKYIGEISNLGDNIKSFGIFNDSIYIDNRLIAITKNIKDNYKVLEGTKEISSYVFDHNFNIKNIYLPNTVKVIKNNAFNYCINLKSINIDNVEIIESNAFTFCTKLDNIILSKELKLLGTASFMGTGIKSLDISNVKIIPNWCFASCLNLKSINIENVELIKQNAFYDLPSLRKINLPNTIKEIEDKSFSKCPKINNKDIKKYNIHN